MWLWKSWKQRLARINDVQNHRMSHRNKILGFLFLRHQQIFWQSCLPTSKWSILLVSCNECSVYSLSTPRCTHTNECSRENTKILTWSPITAFGEDPVIKLWMIIITRYSLSTCCMLITADKNGENMVHAFKEFIGIKGRKLGKARDETRCSSCPFPRTLTHELVWVLLNLS